MIVLVDKGWLIIDCELIDAMREGESQSGRINISKFLANQLAM